MSDPAAAGRLLDAERGVKLARDRLGLTVAELQSRLDPQRLTNKAKHRVNLVKDRAVTTGNTAAHASAKKARANPGVVVGVVAGLIVFASRHRVAALFHRAPPRVPPDPATDPHRPR